MNNVRQINYILQINSFERWLESNFLPPSAQLLWYKLMAICNRSGWQEWVQVDNQRLMTLIGENEKSFICCRSRLISHKLIEYRRGKKGHPSSYKILLLYKTECEAYSAVKMTGESAAIYKQKENINKYENISVSQSYSLNSILDSIDFTDLKRGYAESAELLSEMERIIIEMWFSESIKIGDALMPQAFVRQALSALNYDRIESVLLKFKKAATEQYISNSHGYLRTLIYRSALESSASLEAELCASGMT